MNLLFKLKKDGKTVGYLKIGTVFEGIWFAETRYGNSGQRCPQKIIDGDFDTAHPFVTHDKNGKDVFAGDKVNANGIIVIVNWDKARCRYMLSSIPNQCCYPPALYDNMGSKFIWSEIELIEEQKD